MALDKTNLSAFAQANTLNADSFASDLLTNVAGLKDLNANLDGEATIQATATAKSAASSEGVSGDAASVASIQANAGLTTSIDNWSTPTSTDSNGWFYTSGAPTVKVGDAVKTASGKTYYVESVVPTAFTLSETLGGARATTGLPGVNDFAPSNDIEVSSNAGINNSANATIAATAATTDGNAASVADLGRSAGIENLLDLDVGGNLTMQGKSAAGITASSETVTGEAGATSTLSGSQVGIETTGLADIKADASIQGIAQLTNTAKAATFNTGTTNTLGNSVDGADALASAGNIQGASLADLTIGGIGNVIGQVSLANNAEASNVAGAATAAALQGGGAATPLGGAAPNGLFEGLDLQGPLNIKSDAILDGISNLTAKAVANTTAGDATADAGANLLKGADLSGGTVDVGGTATIKGNLNYGLTALASNVDSGNVSADAQANSGVGLAGKGSGSTNPMVSDAAIGIDIASDATLSGLNIGSLKAAASSAAGEAKATVGESDKAVGAQLPSLDIGGVGTITAGAQLDSAAIAESVGGISIAEAGKSGAVVGLNAVGEASHAFTAPSVSNHSFDNFNINVASDATLTAQAFSNLDATATSTAGIAVATGGLDSTVTGIDSGMDIKVGGIGNLTALAQGTTDATACLLYTSPSPRDRTRSRMPSSA